jgi:cyclin D1/2/4, plant
MAPSCYDVAASMLLCAEDNNSILWLEEEKEGVVDVAGRKRSQSSSPDWDGFGADLFPPQSEECVAVLVEREPEHMPRSNYGERLGRGGVDLCVRRKAVDWIWKVRS